MPTDPSNLADLVTVRGTALLASDTREQYRQKLARITLDSMVQFVGLLDAKGTVLEINQAALDGGGLQLSDVEGKPFWETLWWQVSEEIKTVLKESILRAAEGEFVRWDAEIYGRAVGKEMIVIDASLCPVKDDQGNVVFITAEGRDITEKKAHERELLARAGADSALSQLREELLQRERGQAQEENERQRRSEETSALLAAIVQSSDDAIISKDLNAIITTWNRGAELIFGYTAEEVVGKPITILMPPERINEEPALLERIRSGERIEHYETVRQRKDGKLLDISLTISPVFDPRGRIIGASKIARNISDRKEMEATLLRAHGLGAAGRMAASVAHEINNPLAAVTNLLYLLRPEVKSETATKNLEMAESELARVAQITKKTLAYYQDTAKPGLVSLSDIITDALAVFEKKIDDKHITVVRADQPCTIHGFKGELLQLFSNLIANAVDAVDPSGTIDVSVCESEDCARVSVRDNGIGIPPDQQAKLFEPFFTTKEKYMGTGLGLWISREIAHKHRGQITIESSIGPSNHGTTFTVTFTHREVPTT